MNSHRIGDPARNLAHLIGEAISEDVDAWAWHEPDGLTKIRQARFDRPSDHERSLVVTRDGVDFLVQVRPMSEVDQ